MKKSIVIKVKRYFSKTLSIALVIMLVGASAVRYPILAQEVTPTDTPTPTPEQTTIDNTATVDTTTDTTANTGDNTIGVTPTPTITPDLSDPPEASDSATPSADVSDPPEASDSATTIDNTATVTDTSTSSANTGNNAVTSSDPTPASPDAGQGGPTPTPNAGIMTGTAVALTTLDNNVNSTSVNSNVVNETINIYIDQNASLDLSDPAAFIKQTIEDHPDEPTINLHITSITNQATVNNTVHSVANTGNNEASSSGSAVISTGDAYSLVSVLNRVNLVAIDSVVYVVTINIFGTLNGDIILPVPPASTASDPCPQCSQTADISNSATVTNTVNSNADTGDNSVDASTSGSIQTGDAASQVSINNLVNTVLIGDSVFSLYITPFGDWNGEFVGYLSANPSALNGMSILDANGQPVDTGSTSLTATNAATVTNTITSQANTGGNTIDAGSGTITTGNALSDVSLINLVNTVLYHTTAFFGFINIFGTWNGNVGDQQSLAAAKTTPESVQLLSDTSTSGSDSTGDVHDAGGLLTVTNANNVGAYVNPGDTVTFFVNVKNPGEGHVYNANLSLHLFKDGVDRGGQTFSLGTIDPGHGFKVTTGFVLANTTPGGVYTARAVVTGNVGPDNDPISAAADSWFLVSGSAVLGSSGNNSSGEQIIVSGTVPAQTLVLGSSTSTDSTNVLLALLVLLLLIPEYIFYRATRNRNLLSFVFTGDLNWQARLRAVQTFLL